MSQSEADTTLPPRPATAPRWQQGSWPVWVFFLALLLVLIKDVPAVVIAVVGGPTALGGGQTAMLTLILLLAAGLLAARTAPGRLTRAHLGLQAVPWRQLVLWGVIAIGALYVPLLVGTALGQTGAQDTNLGLGKSLISDVLLLVAAAGVGPVAEEIAYRAVMFRALCDGLAKRVSPRVAAGLAAVISAAVFSLVHVGAPPWHLASYFAFGLVLAVAYWWTGSLLVTVVPHVLNNTYSALALAKAADSAVLMGVALLGPLVAAVLVFAIATGLGSARR